MKLEGAVVLITGGARRLGKAAAEALAARGARVILTYHHSQDEAEETAAGIRKTGGDCAILPLHLEDEGSVRACFASIRERFGKLDALINNAAGFRATPWKDLDAAAWDAFMRVNARGAFLCALHAAPLMPEGGKIINIADRWGLKPRKDFLPYCVSKAALVALTEGLALELAPRIQVNAIAPGAMLPPAGEQGKGSSEAALRDVPLHRWGGAEPVVSAILYLLEGGDYVTGAVLPVDGGSLLA